MMSQLGVIAPMQGVNLPYVFLVLHFNSGLFKECHNKYLLTRVTDQKKCSNTKIITIILISNECNMHLLCWLVGFFFVAPLFCSWF